MKFREVYTYTVFFIVLLFSFAISMKRLAIETMIYTKQLF